MQPWQVSFGVSLAIIAPVVFMVYEELAYLSAYWGLAWAHYGIHLLTVPLMFLLAVIFGIYALARTLVLGDVGSRIGVLDKSIREGRAGDAELSTALQREESGDFES